MQTSKHWIWALSCIFDLLHKQIGLRAQDMHHSLCSTIRSVITCWHWLCVNCHPQICQSFACSFQQRKSAWFTVTSESNFGMTTLQNESAEFCDQVVEASTTLLLSWNSSTTTGVTVCSYKHCQLVTLIMHSTAVEEIK